MPKSISGIELVASVEELARCVISDVEPDERDDRLKPRSVGMFTALRIIRALEEDGFQITRPGKPKP